MFLLGLITLMVCFSPQAVSAPSADVTLTNLVLPESRVLVGIQVDRIKASPQGQVFLSQMESAGPGIKRFIGEIGLDPRRDVEEVLIIGSGNPKENKTAFLLRGTFEQQKVLNAAHRSATAVRHYKGVPMIVLRGVGTAPPSSVPRRLNRSWFALLNNRIGVVAEAGVLQEIVDRQASPVSPNPRVATRISELSQHYDVWWLSLASAQEWADQLTDETLQAAMKGELLRTIQEISGGVQCGPLVEISGQAITRSDKDAIALADVARFFIGLVAASREDHQGYQIWSLLNTLDLKTIGNTVKFRWRIPEDEVEKFLRAVMARTSMHLSSPRPRSPSAQRKEPLPATGHSSASQAGKRGKSRD